MTKGSRHIHMRWLGIVLCIGGLVAAAAPAPAPDATKLLHALPLRFEQDTHGRWVTRGPGFAAFFDQEATVLRICGRTLRLSFTGSNPEAEFEATQPQQAQTNYFVGKQYRSVQAFSRLQRTQTAARLFDQRPPVFERVAR